ncbi:MAG: hypothetical protein JST89_19940 [Cyanobacteria bacterium SZAS-4]|nr:hypothetical protein [Cyanobacteria bacterium SZAS-4]
MTCSSARIKALATLAVVLSANFTPLVSMPGEAATEPTSETTSKSTAQLTSNESIPVSGSGKDFTSGSDFKAGPVTDDDKLLKPVAKDAKNPVDNSTSKLSPNSQPEKKEGTTEAASDQPQQSGKKKAKKPIPYDADEIESSDRRNYDVTINNKGPISIGAVKVAKDLQMLDEIAELNELKKSKVYVPGQRVRNLEVICVRQDLDENILSAFFATRRVVSELDRQVAGYDAVARVLEEKRDQAIRNNTILNFTSGGALAMTQGAISIGTPMKYQNAGNELGAIAGALTTVIGAYALKLQGGGKRSSERDPNMLAPIFGLLPNEPNKYPVVVWDYLSDYEPGQKKTRREQLIDRWVKLNYIEPLNKPSSKKHLQELAGTIPLDKAVSIDLLRDRIPMLQDVRATVAGVNEYLDEILTFVRQP